VIKAYHRPDNKKEAIELYRRTGIESVFILGSSRFGNVYDQDVEAIDLQNIVLEKHESEENERNINCFVSLGETWQNPRLISELKRAISHDYTENQRNSTALMGLLYQAGGNSITGSVFLACDAIVSLLLNDEIINFGDWLILRKNRGYEVCEKISFSIPAKIDLEWVSKTPGDYPELVMTIARWKSGRTRLVIGGVENASPQVVFDGTEKSGIEQSAENACRHLFNSSTKQTYLTKTSLVLLQRLMSSEKLVH